MSLRVLFVCTGNICRSPTAEALLRARLDPARLDPARLGPGLPIEISSAGTGALVGHGLDAPSAVALRELDVPDLGTDGTGHSARQLTDQLVGDADLILTAESGHRSRIVQGAPLAFGKTFTMREFGRLGACLPALPVPPSEPLLRARVAEVAALRGLVEPAGPGADDIGDPFGAPLEFARATTSAIADAVDSVVTALGLAAQPGRR